MTPTEIVEKLVQYVDQHEQNNRGSVHQDPYKSDFFNLFVEAHNSGFMGFDQNPRLTADGIRDALPEHIAVGSPLVQQILGFWQEWTYAWDRANQRVG